MLAGSNGGYFKQGKNIQFNDVYSPDRWDAEPVAPSMGNAVLKPLIDKVASGDQKKIGSVDLSNQDLCVNILTLVRRTCDSVRRSNLIEEILSRLRHEFPQRRGSVAVHRKATIVAAGSL